MNTPNTPAAAERPSCTEAHVVALSALAMRFASGNSVPVERTHITRAEWDALCAFAREQDEIIRAWHARELPAESVSAEPADGWRWQDGEGEWQYIPAFRPSLAQGMRTAGYPVVPLYLHPKPSTPGAVSEEDVESACVAFHATEQYPGTWPHLFERPYRTQFAAQMRAALESFAKRSATPKEDRHAQD